MVRAEHWQSPDGLVSTLVPADADDGTRRAVISTRDHLCCTIAGETWEDCLRQFNRHMGWKEYQPMTEGGGSG